MAYNLESRAVKADFPKSFLFYVVAKVGPSACHYPLAVALRRNCEGSRLVGSCLEIINVLSAPENRIAIDAEMCLATQFYNGDNHYADRFYAPEPSVPGPGMLDLLATDTQHDTDEELPLSSIVEFPFISSCLLLGAGYESARYSAYEVKTQPLGTAYRDDSMMYGMAVFDITDLSNVHYGIVGFAVQYMAQVRLNSWGDWDPVEDSSPENEPEPVVEEDRPRIPLSAARYIEKFGYVQYEWVKKLVDKLEKNPLVHTEAFEYIWPLDIHNQPQKTSNVQPKMPNEQAIANLVDSIADKDSFDISIFNQTRKLPDFQDILLKYLVETSDRLGSTHVAEQLLRLAYTGHGALNWVLFKHLSFDVVASAIKSAELKEAKSLTLCVDDLQCTPATLLQALSRLDNLEHIYFLQGPRRTSDQESMKLFLRILTDAEYSHLLKSKDMTFTHAFSTPLRNNFWFPVSEYRLSLNIFPIQHIFVRHQIDVSDDPKFRSSYFYLADTLLKPERFAAGFLLYLCSIQTDRHLFSFSRATSFLGNPSRGEIGHILAKTFDLPIQTTMAGDNSTRIRDLEKDGWTVVISHNRHLNQEVAEINRRTLWGYTEQARFLRYAFVRARKSISADATPERIQAEDIEVVGLVDFLRATASHIDSALVERELENTAREIAKNQPSLDPDMSWLSVLDESEARMILNGILLEKAYMDR